MRRLVLPILVFLITCLAVGESAFGQFSASDSIGFGDKLRDTIWALPGDTFDLPIFLSTDSMVTGVSAIIRFDKDILWPILGHDSRFQRIIDSLDSVGAPEFLYPDSTEWVAAPAYDSGLWDVQVGLTSFSSPTWNLQYGFIQGFHNLNSPDTVRLLMAPTASIDTANYVKPYIAGDLDGGKGAPIATIKFWVNPAVAEGTVSTLQYITETPDQIKTELAEEWFTGGDGTETRAILPTQMSSFFIAKPDTGDTTGPGPGPEENKPPVLTLGTAQTVFDIKQGEQVSFTVTATDEEGGEVRITANNGNLPPNASLAPSNPVIGGGGIVTGTFSFKPDISQQGSYAFSFVAQDDSGATSSTKAVTVNVAELDIDVLFTASNDSLAPEGGVPGLNEVMVPINVVSKKTIYGVQYDMDYNASYFDLDSIFVTDRIPDWVIYDNIGATPGSVRVVSFGLANDPMVTGSSSAILYMAFTVDEFAEFGGYPLDIYNAWESIDPDPNVPSLELVTANGILYVDKWGDVNLDLRIDVADLVNVVAYIIGNYDLSRRQHSTADIVINDTVNVVDLVGIVNTIFGWPITPAPAQQWQGEYAQLKVLHNEIPGPGIESEMQISADMPATVAGVELEIRYNPGVIDMLAPQLADGADGFELRSNDNDVGVMKVLIYSRSPWNDERLIREGLSDIVKLPFVSRGSIAGDDNQQVRITRAYVSTGTARNIPVEGVGGPPLPNTFSLFQNRPNPFNPTTTIDFYIGGSDQTSDIYVTLDVFNLLGQRVKTLVDESLPPGQYSYVWDGTDHTGERMASGVYLYRLRVGDESHTKKMMLLK